MSAWGNFLSESFGFSGLSENEQRKRRLVVELSLWILGAGLMHNLTYLILGYPNNTYISLLSLVATIANILLYYFTQRFQVFKYGLLLIVLAFPLLNQLSFGSFVDASGVGLAMLLTSFGALTFGNQRVGRFFLILYIVCTLFLGVWEYLHIDEEYQIPRVISLAFFVQNFIFIGLIAYFITESFYLKMERYQNELEDEREKSVKLLLNILPAETAEELKATGSATAKGYVSSTVLFTDFVGFSKASRHMTPNELVQELDFYFKEFDRIIDRNNLEKIKTIGDAYMCVGGIPIVTEKHARNAVMAAIEMQQFVKGVLREKLVQQPFDLRIGIHTGPLIAGVVGKNKFSYDIWGDTVNVASRMESASEPGKINISESTFLMVLNEFDCTYRGELEIKNMGTQKMYFVNHESLDVRTAKSNIDNG